MTPDHFWSNRFHWCALAAGFIAASEGRLDDAVYVRELAYSLYEGGAFRDRAVMAVKKPDSCPAEPLPASLHALGT